MSHLEYGWEEPSLARFYRKLASFSRLILFDKRGTGLSDQSTNLPTLEERMDDALCRQLENVHSQVAEMKAAKPQMEQQIKDTEDLLDRTPDPNAHADLESRIKGGKANLARLTQEDERLRNSELAHDTELQAAQAKLNEVNASWMR